MIKKLSIEIDKFTHVLHVADIHIRLNKRHDEYREVFQRLYEAVERTPETTVVALVGDVFHSKSDLSPECVQMAADLFDSLSNIRPLILTAGNHDATLSNKSRLDSLTPVVDTLNHKNLYYLKTTGLYAFSNILWNNMCVFDGPEKYIRGQDIPAVYRNEYEHIIALFHGAVDRAALETGYSISNPAIMNPLFDWNDMALLGDIHMTQDMQDYDSDNHKPCIHYVGSMIQQNHGEGLRKHGYSLWDLSTRSYTFHELPNQYGYFTIEIHKGQLTTDLSDLPSKVRLRVKCFETVASEIKSNVSNIKTLSDVIEISYLRMDKNDPKTDVIPICKDILLKDLNNTEYQNKLITEYLTKKLGIVDQSTIDTILDINKKTNSLIKRDEFARNLRWKPIRFEWDNMFTYGEGNVIDFTKMNGVYGIFGPNRSGKSSVLSALIFCLFDKFDRGFKGMYVLNVQKSTFRCKLEFEIAGVRYFIERKGTTTRSGNVKVDVKFWKAVNGIEEELHGNARRDTNDIIRDYVGTYEDFLLTAASFQTAKNLTSFIDMGNSERKDLLVQFIGLNIFDRLDEAASERNKELNAMLKIHKDRNYAHEILQYENFLSQANGLFNQTNSEIDSLKKQIQGVNDQIAAETFKLIRLEDGVPTNLEAIESTKSTLERSIKQKKESLEKFRKSLSEKETIISGFDQEIQKIESSDLVQSHKTYKTLSTKIADIKKNVESKKVEIRNKLDKVERLKTHRYDPNCKFCVENEFVKDAIKANNELPDDKELADKLINSLENVKEEFCKYQWVEEAYDKYTKLLTDKSRSKDEQGTLSRNIIISSNELEKLEVALKAAIHQIELYNRNVVSVETNEKINITIQSYKNALKSLEVDLQRKNKELMDVSGKVSVFKSKIDDLEKTLKELKLLEDEFESYKIYLSCVNRDGISYQVICNTVPQIEQEVNSILSQVADYTIQFETDGKNVIPYIVYDYGRWPIELSSGYERFVASIAIRVAMSNVSNLPRTTCLFIDEGFGTLEADNLASMYTLFSFLKSNFDFIIVISHLDALKDAVDKQIELRREGNFSKVIFE